MSNLPPGTTEQHITKRFGDEQLTEDDKAQAVVDADKPYCPRCYSRMNQTHFGESMTGMHYCDICGTWYNTDQEGPQE